MDCTLQLLLGLLLTSISIARCEEKSENTTQSIINFNTTINTIIPTTETILNNRDINKIIKDQDKEQKSDHLKHVSSKSTLTENHDTYIEKHTNSAESKDSTTTTPYLIHINDSKPLESTHSAIKDHLSVEDNQNNTKESTKSKFITNTNKKNNSRALDFASIVSTEDFYSKNNVLTTEPPSSEIEDAKHAYSSKFDLTTPVSAHFDKSFKETVDSVAQNLDIFAPSGEEEDFSIEDNDDIFNHTKIEYVSTKNIEKTMKLDKNSIHKDTVIEHTRHIDFDDSYNDTNIYENPLNIDEDEKKSVVSNNNITDLESLITPVETVTIKSTLNKPIHSKNDNILSNNIENETIKSIVGPLVTNISKTNRSEHDSLVIETDISGTDKSQEEETTVTSNTTTDSSLASLTTEPTNIDNHIIKTTTIIADLTETATNYAPVTSSSNLLTDIENDTTTTEVPTATNSSDLTDTSTVTEEISTSTEYSTSYSVVIETVHNKSVKTVNEYLVTESYDFTSTLTSDFEYDSTTSNNDFDHDATTSTGDLETTTALINSNETEVTTEDSVTTTTDLNSVTLQSTDGSLMNDIVKETSTNAPLETTTEFAFVHLQNVDNHTTAIPETLGPNFSYTTMKIPLNNINNTMISTDTVPTTRSSIAEPVTAATPDTTTSIPLIIRNNDDIVTTENADDADNEVLPTEDGLSTKNEPSPGTVAAIAISCVAAVCLVLLAGLLYVMRKRQKRFKYGPRCTPVSLDEYSIENLSVYNSVSRRKGANRMSKRSYGNPAFDDPSSASHPLNFPALAKFSTNIEDMKAEFQEIPQITARTSELPDGCDTKNRYANVIPLPETRVYLKPIDGYPNSDYINANYVTGPKNSKSYYIATQAPMENTVDDFWRMIWEQNCKVILMLTQHFENGLEKCADYLPPSEVLDCNRLFGDYQITLKKREVKDKYIISSLQLKDMVSNSWRDVTHFWYLGWPEKGVPTEGNSLIAFLIEARSYMKSATLDNRQKDSVNGIYVIQNGSSILNDVSPVVVHCSPGTGRTGVVIACDIAIRDFEQTRLVDIPKIVYRIRRDRASAVQTNEQYQFIYKVVSLYAMKLTGEVLDT